MPRGLVRFDLENLGTEVWLVSNPSETQTAFEDASGEESPLDAAARVGKDCIVLQAHWGNDIPREPDTLWLDAVLAATREDQREEVRDLVGSWYELQGSH